MTTTADATQSLVNSLIVAGWYRLRELDQTTANAGINKGNYVKRDYFTAKTNVAPTGRPPIYRTSSEPWVRSITNVPVVPLHSAAPAAPTPATSTTKLTAAAIAAALPDFTTAPAADNEAIAIKRLLDAVNNFQLEFGDTHPEIVGALGAAADATIDDVRSSPPAVSRSITPPPPAATVRPGAKTATTSATQIAADAAKVKAAAEASAARAKATEATRLTAQAQAALDKLNKATSDAQARLQATEAAAKLAAAQRAEADAAAKAKAALAKQQKAEQDAAAAAYKKLQDDEAKAKKAQEAANAAAQKAAADAARAQAIQQQKNAADAEKAATAAAAALAKQQKADAAAAAKAQAAAVKAAAAQTKADTAAAARAARDYAAQLAADEKVRKARDAEQAKADAKAIADAQKAAAATAKALEAQKKAEQAELNKYIAANAQQLAANPGAAVTKKITGVLTNAVLSELTKPITAPIKEVIKTGIRNAWETIKQSLGLKPTDAAPTVPTQEAIDAIDHALDDPAIHDAIESISSEYNIDVDTLKETIHEFMHDFGSDAEPLLSQDFTDTDVELRADYVNPDLNTSDNLGPGHEEIHDVDGESLSDLADDFTDTGVGAGADALAPELVADKLIEGFGSEAFYGELGIEAGVEAGAGAAAAGEVGAVAAGEAAAEYAASAIPVIGWVIAVLAVLRQLGAFGTGEGYAYGSNFRIVGYATPHGFDGQIIAIARNTNTWYGAPIGNQAETIDAMNAYVKKNMGDNWPPHAIYVDIYTPYNYDAIAPLYLNELMRAIYPSLGPRATVATGPIDYGAQLLEQQRLTREQQAAADAAYQATAGAE